MMRHLSEPGDRGFWAGVALSSPFVALALPNYLVLVLVIPLLVHCLFHGFPLENLKTPPLIIYAVLALGSLHLLSLLLSTTPYWLAVVKDLAKAAAAIGIFFAARHQSNDLLRGFFAVIVPVGIAASIVGLLKFVLLLNGFLLAPFISACGGVYSRGAALCGDYNLFGMLLLLTAIGLIIRISVHDAAWDKRTVAWLIGLAGVMTSGLLAGSRRFVILAPLVFVYWLWLSFQLQAWRRFKLQTAPAVAAVAILSLLVFALPPAPTENPTVLVFDQNILSLQRTARDQDGNLVIVATTREHPPAIARAGSPEADASPPRVSFNSRPVGAAMAIKFAAESSYGLNTRIGRWQLATDMIAKNPLGSGFAYHHVFSCRFVGCQFQDYPHMPILSAALMGGWIAGLVAIAIYLLVGCSIWRAGRRGFATGATAIALVVLPYSLLSGDTVLSLPHFLIAALMLEGQIEEKSGLA